MTNGIDLGGFTLSTSTQRIWLIFLIVYSIAIVGMGLYVQIMSRRGGDNKFATFLTGGGNLGAVAIAMISCTNLAAGGVMMGAPGLTYSVGFIYSICVFSGFLSTFASLMAVGRKAAIVRNRLGATTFIQLMRHRFQSKKVAVVMAIGGFIFLSCYASGQITSGAKLLSAITGGKVYTWGLILITLIAVIYTLTGGMKSLAKVAVVQGAVIVVAVCAVFVSQRLNVTEQYGSIQSAMEFVAESKPSLLKATVWTPLYTFGTMLLTSWALSSFPHGLNVTMTYNSPKKYAHAIIIGTVTFILMQGIMSSIGPLNYALNQNITTADYNTIYIASDLVPPWVGAVLIASIVAAIQSSIAGMCIAAASGIAKDIYKDIIKTDAPEKSVSRVNYIALICSALISILIALKPTTYTQLLINFSIGGLAASWIMPVLFGLYSRKATGAACFASSLTGLIAYLVGFLLSNYAKPFWVGVLGNVHPVVPACLLSFLVMIIVSKNTKKVPFGIYQVWFGQEYDESYAKEYNLT